MKTTRVPDIVMESEDLWCGDGIDIVKRVGANVSVSVTRHYVESDGEVNRVVVGRLWIDAEALRLALPELARAVEPIEHHRQTVAQRHEQPASVQ